MMYPKEVMHQKEPTLEAKINEWSDKLTEDKDGKKKSNKVSSPSDPNQVLTNDLLTRISIFGSKSSIVGVPFIKWARSTPERVVWVLVFLASIGATIFHLNSLVDKYFSYEKNTKITLGFSNLDFPAVTICNVNAIRMSQIHNFSADLRALIEKVSIESFLEQVGKYEPTFSEEELETLGQEDDSYSKMASMKMRSSNFFDALPELINVTSPRANTKSIYQKMFQDTWKAESKQSSYYWIQETFMELFVHMSPSHRRALGHQIQNMLLQCSFAGGQCLVSNFSWTPSALYGNCYTLEYDKWIAKSSGPDYGLELILYLETHEYVPGISNEKGLQLVIHERGTMPFPDDEGIAIAAGSQTIIGLKQVQISRLGTPYGDCTDPLEFTNKYGIKYTRTACQSICEMNLIKDRCHCYDNTRLPTISMRNLTSGMEPCSTHQEVSCMVQVQMNFENSNVDCKCDSPCSELQFRKTISSRQWPRSGFAKVLTAVVCKTNPRDDCVRLKNMSATNYQSEEFIKLNIYFEDLNYEKLVETADYELEQFLSDVGGTLGLYIGLSVLGLFELLHLTYDLASYLLSLRHKRKYRLDTVSTKL